MLKGLRVGFPTALFGKGLDDEVGKSVKAVVDVYRDWVLRLLTIELPHAGYAIAVYYIIATAEHRRTWHGLMVYVMAFGRKKHPSCADVSQTREEGFGPEVKRRDYAGDVCAFRRLLRRLLPQGATGTHSDQERLSDGLQKCDAIITPTSPTPAFAIGEKVDDPLAMYLNDIYTVTANLAGVPGLSVPCGLSSARLPIGFQLFGPYWSEPTLLKLAHSLS